MKIILCAGISVRSGTNYTGSISSEISTVDSLPKNTSKGDSWFFGNKTYHICKYMDSNSQYNFH